MLVECAVEVNSKPREFFHLLYDQVPRTRELIEQVEEMNRQLVLGFSECLQSHGFSAEDALLTSRLTVTAVDSQGASGCAGIGFTRRTSSANGSRRTARDDR